MTQVKLSTSRPCNLQPYEVRRVPQRTSSWCLIGYHVMCPACGFNNIAHNDGESNTLTEGEGEGDITAALPMRCLFCRVVLQLTHGDLTMHPDEETKRVRYQR